jgi:hypothetical protein
LLFTASRINVILLSWSIKSPFDFRMFLDQICLILDQIGLLLILVLDLCLSWVLTNPSISICVKFLQGVSTLSGCVVIVFLCVRDFGGLINVITNFCLGSSLVICNAKMCFKYMHLDRAVVYARFVVLVVMSSLLFILFVMVSLELKCCVCMTNNISFISVLVSLFISSLAFLEPVSFFFLRPLFFLGCWLVLCHFQHFCEF